MSMLTPGFSPIRALPYERIANRAYWEEANSKMPFRERGYSGALDKKGSGLCVHYWEPFQVFSGHLHRLTSHQTKFGSLANIRKMHYFPIMRASVRKPA